MYQSLFLCRCGNSGQNRGISGQKLCRQPSRNSPGTWEQEETRTISTISEAGMTDMGPDKGNLPLCSVAASTRHKACRCFVLIV